MKLGNYYKGEKTPPIKQKNKFLIIFKKSLLFLIFKFIDFVFWIKAKYKKANESMLMQDIKVAFLIFLLPLFFIYFLLVSKSFSEKTSKKLKQWLKLK